MKKGIIIIAVISCLLMLAGCGHTITNEENREHSDLSSSSSSDKSNDAIIPNAQKSSSQEASASSHAFCGIDISSFSGGVEKLFYAADGKLLVYADNLYLYDTVTGSVISEYSFDGGRLSEMTCTPLPNGYAVIGYRRPDKGISSGLISSTDSGYETICYVFDPSLHLLNSFSLQHLLPTESDIITAKASPDGDHIAFSDVNNLYLYSISNNSVSTIVSDTGNSEIGIINEIAFTQHGSRIVFLGDICGSIMLSGSDLVSVDPQGYALGDSMIAYDEIIWFPQDFTKASGKLLMLDGNFQNSNIVDFAKGDTGKDGVYGSEKGQYLASATLMAQGVRVNVYDASTMELISSQEFTNTDSSYFARIPRAICLMDDARAGVVLCGYDQHTIAFNLAF